MNNIRQFASHMFNKYPVLSNSIIYGTLCVGAELSQQTVARKVTKTTAEPFDGTSLGRFAIYGTAIAGPMLTVWYRWLDTKFVGTTMKVVSRKLFVDQLTFTPFLLVVFYTSMSFMEHKPDVFEECRQKFVQTYKSSCFFWIPGQLINFMLIPPAFRVVYIGTCSFAWVNILCWIKQQGVEDEQKQEV